VMMMVMMVIGGEAGEDQVFHKGFPGRGRSLR
jgi:hypothetical protein